MSGRHEDDELRTVVEVVLLAAERPVTVEDLVALLGAESGRSVPELREAVQRALGELGEACAARGVELRQVASGFRYQVREEYARWVARLLGERPARYSRALLETLALIAYRQPVTRGEIEDVRGVGVGPSIMRTLHEREWIRVLSHRDVPGRPALYGTTARFLDDFGLKGVEDLPPLDRIGELAPTDLFPVGNGGADDAARTPEPGSVVGRGAGIGGGAGADGGGDERPRRLSSGSGGEEE